MPFELERLDLSNMYILKVPYLDTYINMVSLSLYMIEVCDLTVVPPNLQYFNCSYSKFVALPPLPSTLTHLECIGNLLTSIPIDNLVNLSTLICCYNKIRQLPNLPDALQKLNCHSNPGMKFRIPPYLTQLWCENTSPIYFRDLPASITHFGCNFIDDVIIVNATIIEIAAISTQCDTTYIIKNPNTKFIPHGSKSTIIYSYDFPYNIRNYYKRMSSYIKNLMLRK
jgi:hypothetical protein